LPLYYYTVKTGCLGKVRRKKVKKTAKENARRTFVSTGAGRNMAVGARVPTAAVRLWAAVRATYV